MQENQTQAPAQQPLVGLQKANAVFRMFGGVSMTVDNLPKHTKVQAAQYEFQRGCDRFVDAAVMTSDKVASIWQSVKDTVCGEKGEGKKADKPADAPAADKPAEAPVAEAAEEQPATTETPATETVVEAAVQTPAPEPEAAQPQAEPVKEAPQPQQAKPASKTAGEKVAAHSLFVAMWERSAYRLNRIPEEWRGSTGYFEKIVNLNFGSQAKAGSVIAFTEDATQRRGLIVVTPVGNLVMFERYTKGDGGLVVAQAADSVIEAANLGGMAEVTPERFWQIFDKDGNNVGHRINTTTAETQALRHRQGPVVDLLSLMREMNA